MEVSRKIRKLLVRYGPVLALLGGITFLHYSHESHLHSLHGVYKLFFFLPIILGGFRGGKMGGLVISSLVLVVFIPHAFVEMCGACGSTSDKFIEMALYLGVGLLTGALSDNLTQARNHLQKSLEEKSAMESELMRTTRLAAVGKLSAGLAHEIRNPLASIQGSAEVLADGFAEDHPRGRMLGILLDETKRLNSVLSRFLEFARSEPGETEAFDLRREVEDVADMIRHHPEYSHVRCEVRPAGGQFVAMGNREQIRQVLLNLALNAAAACTEPAILRLDLTRSSEHCLCRVTDTGMGFTSEARQQFGTPFFSTKEQGTGMGLATSLKIVQDLGGRLEPGPELEGGCVIMTLPVAKAKTT